MDTGILRFIPKGLVLAKKGEKLNERQPCYVAICIQGKVIGKWLTASSAENAKFSFRELLRKEHPTLSLHLEEVYVFKKK